MNGCSTNKRHSSAEVFLNHHLLQDLMDQRLDNLNKSGLLRTLTPIGGVGVCREVEGRIVVSFCSNDYLGLTLHPRVKNAASRAAVTLGTGSGSSRLISGDYRLLGTLEEELADFVGCEATLIFGSGFLANLGVITTLATQDDRLFSDRLNHASIVDGCRLSRSEVHILPHGDLAALEAGLAQPHPGHSFWVGESLFSMDGDLLPLEEMLAITHHAGAGAVVDDAHALGILGPEGRGLCFGQTHFPLAVVGTFGKVLGSYGAFVGGSHTLRQLLINCARSEIFTTALPPPVIAAALEALRVLREEPEHRLRLLENIQMFHQGLQSLGFDVGSARHHIVPIVVGQPEVAVHLAHRLLERGIFARAIRPPTVPAGTCRIRFTLSAAHTREQLQQALEVLAEEVRDMDPGRELVP